MTAFTLDISGAVHLPDYPPPNGVEHWHWHYLDAFTQGYVEALFESLRERWAALAAERGHNPANLKHPGFSGIAPETLGLILRDCAGLATDVGRRARMGLRPGAAGGRAFWEARQRGVFPAYPALTPYLGDGKVYLREVAR